MLLRELVIGITALVFMVSTLLLSAFGVIHIPNRKYHVRCYVNNKLRVDKVVNSVKYSHGGIVIDNKVYVGSCTIDYVDN